jgi:hypothetical protein
MGPPKVMGMTRRSLARSVRGGVVLDLVVALGLVLLAAFALESIGITWADLLRSAARFFGL